MSNAIPNPRTSAAALAVTDGATTIGFVIPHDGEFFAFDHDQNLLGEFKTQRQAMRAIPSAKGDA